jgi:hypothetical protein
MSSLNTRYVELLKNFDSLPQTAIVPIPVAAAYRGISEKTIRRKFQLIAIRPPPRRAQIRANESRVMSEAGIMAADAAIAASLALQFGWRTAATTQ